MRVIIGYGNELRGEDAFGVDVVKELEKYKLNDVKCIATFQLTPEIILELLDADEIIFIDAAYSQENHYQIVSVLLYESESNLSYNITPITIIEMLKALYNKNPSYCIYSMLTNQFDTIKNKDNYRDAIKSVVSDILTERN